MVYFATPPYQDDSRQEIRRHAGIHNIIYARTFLHACMHACICMLEEVRSRWMGVSALIKYRGPLAVCSAGT